MIQEMDKMNALFDSLIESIEASTDDNSLNTANVSKKQQLLLLNIKKTHQTLRSDLETKQNALLDKQKQQQRLQRNIEALQFERLHLERQVQQAKAFQTPKLLQMARDEIEDKPDSLLSDEDVLRKCFRVDEWSHEQHRIAVTAQIHQEINARGRLGERLKRRRQELKQLQSQLDENRKFLDHVLPEQVAAMERSSLTLQKSFSLPKTSSERKERFELAQNLSLPLYTLFKQLQLYVDLMEAHSRDWLDHDESSRMSVRFICHDSESGRDTTGDQVLLHLPVPNAATASGKMKRVTVHFQLDEDNQVLASVSGGANILMQDTVLQELFPGDHAPASRHPHRRAYHWCNYMAGLYSVGMPPALPSTKGILMQLTRRVRSSATLKYILTSLQQRKQLPDIPNDNDDGKDYANVKISSFEENKSENPDELLVKWTCRLRHATKSWVFDVQIDMARYPVSPPIWFLQPGKANTKHGPEQVASATTYDETLASVQEKVNYFLLEQLSSESEGAFEWILVLQMRVIMAECFLMDSKKGSAARKRKFSR